MQEQRHKWQGKDAETPRWYFQAKTKNRSCVCGLDLISRTRTNQTRRTLHSQPCRRLEGGDHSFSLDRAPRHPSLFNLARPYSSHCRLASKCSHLEHVGAPLGVVRKVRKKGEDFFRGSVDFYSMCKLHVSSVCHVSIRRQCTGFHAGPPGKAFVPAAASDVLALPAAASCGAHILCRTAAKDLRSRDAIVQTAGAGPENGQHVRQPKQ
jgi:hypothetical protein